MEGVLKNFQEMISYANSALLPTIHTSIRLRLTACSKYQFMQANIERRLAGLKDKIPDIQKTLDTVGFLKRRKVLSSIIFCHLIEKLIAIQPDAEPLEATFELNDTLYAKANIEETEEVYLWLGVRFSLELSTKTAADRGQANVMLSYPLAEAQELLETKLSAAKSSMTNCEEDLDFLREQVTVC